MSTPSLWDQVEAGQILPANSNPDFSWADNTELLRRITEFAATMPDYSDVVDIKPWPIPAHIEAYLRASLRGPQIGYYLGHHPDLFLKIVTAAPPARGIAMLLGLERELRRHETLCSSEALYSNLYRSTPTQTEENTATQLLQLFAPNGGGFLVS